MEYKMFSEVNLLQIRILLSMLKDDGICIDVDIEKLSDIEIIAILNYCYEEINKSIEKEKNKRFFEKVKDSFIKKNEQENKMNLDSDKKKKKINELKQLKRILMDVKEKRFEQPIKSFIDNEQIFVQLTPYGILGLAEGEYSKEVLSAAMENQISRINDTNMSEKTKLSEIDVILDAYNELINKKRLR